MVIASLAIEHINDSEKSILELNVVSRGIYFIQKGTVSLIHMDDKNQAIVTLTEGSYFGDISYIFKVINKYKYMYVQPLLTEARDSYKFYSLKDHYIEEIFNRFPEFYNVSKVRALRRHHYFRSLKNQMKKIIKIKAKASFNLMMRKK